MLPNKTGSLYTEAAELPPQSASIDYLPLWLAKMDIEFDCNLPTMWCPRQQIYMLLAQPQLPAYDLCCADMLLHLKVTSKDRLMFAEPEPVIGLQCQPVT